MRPGLRKNILRGITRALPMAVGYIVIGFSVAATSYAVGFSALNTVAMSTLVYAGTSQLIATKMLSAGAGLGAVVITTFIVNARHLLMSSALSPQLRSMTRLELLAFCFTLSDESFAMHSTAAAQKHWAGRAEMLAVNATLGVSWVAGALLAIFLQLDAGYLSQFGLDYAPAAMFVALLALLCRDGVQRAVAIFCGLISVSLVLAGTGAESVLISTLLGASFGAWGEAWTTKKSSIPSSR